MKRISKKEKVELIHSSQAYVEKCDGGFWFYLKAGPFVRISKDLFWDLQMEENKRDLKELQDQKEN